MLNLSQNGCYFCDKRLLLHGMAFSAILNRKPARRNDIRASLRRESYRNFVNITK